MPLPGFQSCYEYVQLYLGAIVICRAYSTLHFLLNSVVARSLKAELKCENEARTQDIIPDCPTI